MSEVLFQGVFACGSGARPAAQLASQLSTMTMTMTNGVIDVSAIDTNTGPGTHCDHCQDMDVVAHVQSNTKNLMSALADQLIKISVPGVVEKLDLIAVVTSATAAMETFATQPAAASSPHLD